jgi:ArsR family transcriptional regulator, lead/cadmium/zinc/bismuth-responsive transcriptional repressor
MLPTDCKMKPEDIDKARKAMLDIHTIDDLSGLFKIFGDSTRIRILWILDAVGEMCVCGMSETLDMSISAVSHQLRILKDADLIKGRRDGKNIYYSLCDHHVKLILEMALEHRREGRE